MVAFFLIVLNGAIQTCQLLSVAIIAGDVVILTEADGEAALEVHFLIDSFEVGLKALGCAGYVALNQRKQCSSSYRKRQCTLD